MKKLSLMLLGALVTAQVAQANAGSFTGFYLGGNLGWTQRNDKTNLEAYDVTEGFPPMRAEQNGLSKSNKANGLNYGLYGGYGQNNNGFYWGAEFNIEHDTVNKGNTNNNLEIKGNGVPMVNGHGRLYTKYERGVVFGLTPRIGAVIGNANLFYVKLGMEYSHDKMISYWRCIMNGNTVEENTRRPDVVRKKQIVFVPGIGYERAFGKLLARIEYGYNFGAKIQSPGLINDGFSDNHRSKATVKYSAHILKLGLAYKF